jgi:hypothetical protein
MSNSVARIRPPSESTRIGGEDAVLRESSAAAVRTRARRPSRGGDAEGTGRCERPTKRLRARNVYGDSAKNGATRLVIDLCVGAEDERCERGLRRTRRAAIRRPPTSSGRQHLRSVLRFVLGARNCRTSDMYAGAGAPVRSFRGVIDHGRHRSHATSSSEGMSRCGAPAFRNDACASERL